MPPSMVKTVKDLIHWEYSKLIADSTVGDRKNFRFIVYTFKKLQNGNINPSSILRENKMLVSDDNCCAYCGSTEHLEWEHIIPKTKICIDTIDNQVLACRTCNASKGGRDPFEWYGKERMYEIPRIVLGKYLKLIYDLHEQQGTLEHSDLDGNGKLDIFDLGIVLKIDH